MKHTYLSILSSLIFSSMSMAAESPNMVVINVDDLGWSDVNYRPGQKERYFTPNISALAKESMVFTNGYAACPVCSPTRASLVTGKSTAALKLTAHIAGNPSYVKNKTPKNATLLPAESRKFLPLEEVTFAEVLKKNGYRTGFIGKWHLAGEGGSVNLQLKGNIAPEYHPEHQGFDVNIAGCAYGSPKKNYFSPYKMATLKDGKDGEYLTDRLTDEAINFISESKGKKFILYLNTYTVHTPLSAPKERKEELKKLGENAGTYAAMVYSLDLMIGKITDHLEKTGLADNTLLMFTSDNGGIFGNKPLKDNKGTLYEGGIRVPFIVRWPGVVKAGSVSDEPMISYDLFPTLLAAAGCLDQAPDDVEGEDLTPILKGEEGFNREQPLIWHYPHYHHGGLDMGTAIRHGDWKYVHSLRTGKSFLFNLKEDQGEKENLISSKPEKAEQLKKLMHRRLKELDANMPIKREASEIEEGKTKKSKKSKKSKKNKK